MTKGSTAWKVVGGESNEPLDAFLADIERNFSGKRVVVVTHGGILNIVHRILTGVKFPGKIPNTSISTITKSVGKGGDWRIESYAVCDHLGEGEFGRVMMARKNATQEIFAVKVLRKTKLLQRGGKTVTRAIWEKQARTR